MMLPKMFRTVTPDGEIAFVPLKFSAAAEKSWGRLFVVGVDLFRWTI